MWSTFLSLTREALPADVAEGAPGVVGDVPLVRLRHPGRGRRSPVAFDGGLQSISQFPSGDLHPLTNHFLLILLSALTPPGLEVLDPFR